MIKIRALTEGVTQDIIADLMTENGLTIKKAMETFYNSETFDKLSNDETGLYRESSAYVFDLLKSELENGAFVQTEI